MNAYWDVSVENCFDENGEKNILIKISCDVAEVNIWLSSQEIFFLREFLENKNNEHCQFGKTAKSYVFWVFDENGISILIGDDIETWDIALTLGEEGEESLKEAVLGYF